MKRDPAGPYVIVNRYAKAPWSDASDPGNDPLTFATRSEACAYRDQVVGGRVDLRADERVVMPLAQFCIEYGVQMPERVYKNYYYCEACDFNWDDTWSCMCNDKCPQCGKEIEPHASDGGSPA